jgi:hypothetical protein
MAQFVKALFIGTIATVLVGGTAFMPSPAEAAKLSKAEQVAVKQATVACKAEAKGRKLGWLAGRRFVKRCLIQALKEHPNIDVNVIYPDLKNIKETIVENPI